MPLETELRLECLRLAISANGPAHALELAAEYYRFVAGQVKQSPRDTIIAALDTADVR